MTAITAPASLSPGATRALVMIAAVLGTGLSVVATWGLMRFVFEIPFAPPLLDYGALAAASFAISTLLGGTTGRPIRVASPLAALRASSPTA